MIPETLLTGAKLVRHFNVHGHCRVRLRTNCAFFADYAAAFLAGFECEPFREPADVDSIYLSRDWGPVVDQVRAKDAALISDNAWLDGRRLVTVRRGTLYVADSMEEGDNTRFQLAGWFREPRILRYTSRVPRKYSMRLGMWNSINREEYHLQTVRDLLHYPIFAVLRKRGFTVLHGSCVSRDGRSLSVFGYNRVGKSSLTLALMVHHGWNPVSDNFILTDGNEVYAFPERLRYSEETLHFVGATGLSVAGKPICWNKYHFDLPELGREMEPVTIPAKSFYLLRGSGEVAMRELDPADAAERMGAMNSFLHEFDNYSFLNLLPGFYSFEDRSLLHRFFENCPVFECRGGKSIHETAKALAESVAT